MVLMDVGVFVIRFVWSPDIIPILDNNLFRIFCRKQHVVATTKESHTNIVTQEKKKKKWREKEWGGGGGKEKKTRIKDICNIGEYGIEKQPYPIYRTYVVNNFINHFQWLSATLTLLSCCNSNICSWIISVQLWLLCLAGRETWRISNWSNVDTLSGTTCWVRN